MPRPELNQLLFINPYFRWVIPLSLTIGIISLFQIESCSVFEETVSYNRDIRPILNKNCLSCHGGVKESGGFSLLFEEDALGPTESGVPAIIPGDPEGSEMIRRLTHSDPELRMPQEKEPLSEEEIHLLKKWIRQGAKWEDHWAYISPDENIKPPSLNDAWVKNGIDAFILRKLNEKKITPNEAANKAVLLRRASLDLTGLPPTPTLHKAYLSGKIGWENVLDSLMSSPHFGEKWAAWWMDLARYADSKGYEKDLNRSIWKYRDWVIQAFNKDLPFDQFTVQQLAGDMLPDATEDQIIATAFHRNSIANDEGGTDDEEFRVAANIERVGVTWEVWQGTTMACVQCHSHPYDPFRHEDFYRFMAFLNNTQDKDIYNEQPKLFTYPDSSVEKVEELIKWLNEKGGNEISVDQDTFLYEKRSQILYQMGYRRVEAEEYQDHSRFIELTSPDQLSVFQIQDSSWIMYEDVNLTDVEKITYRFASAYSGGFVEIRLDSLNGPVISKTLLPGTKRWVNWEEKTVKIQPVSGTHDLYYYFYMNQDYVSDLFRLDWIQYHLKDSPSNRYGREMKTKLARLWEISAVQTPVMRELKRENRRTSHRFLRGNWLTPGEEVAPNIPGSMIKSAQSSPENRLEMAQWLVSPENPLTSRVIVNRIWEQIFGYGIVETLEDFGSQGVTPAHPEMLDWLAVRFVKEHRWSFKSFLKEIMLSATYQQSSVADSSKIEADPRNLLLSRGPRVRLSAEQIRDQALAVSGLLDEQMYGPPVLLAIPDKRTRDPYAQADLITYDPYRRSLYNFWKRTIPNPYMTTFDSPDRNVCTSRRIRTNTPLQALVMLNDSVFFDAAQNLGLDIASSIAEPEKQITTGYQRIMGMPINEKTEGKFMDLYQEAHDLYKENPEYLTEFRCQEKWGTPSSEVAALTLVFNAMMNTDLFLNKF